MNKFVTKRIVLHFPKNMVNQPIVYRLVKDFDLEFNILKAEINPKEEGLLVLELKGTSENYKRGIEYLKKEKVSTQPLSHDVTMNKEKCVDCSVCVPLCPTKALVCNETTREVTFIKNKCVACGICIPACPYGAMNISF